MNMKKTENKREVYISVDKDEMATLRLMGWRERWLYMELKWLANFKTGEVGAFGRQCITYEQLAALVSVPASQGREADVISGKEAARLMMRLHAAGLIGEVGKRNNGGLHFALPLSPIQKDAARKSRNNKASTERLPEQGEDKPIEKTDEHSDCDELSDSQSVMTPFGCLNTLFNTVISSDGAVDTPAPYSVGSAPTPGYLENPNPDALTIKQIKDRLDAGWFAYVDALDSARFYEAWLRQGFSVNEFEQAVVMVEQSDSPTPAAVDQMLRRQRVQQAKPSNGWGRVAL